MTTPERAALYEAEYTAKLKGKNKVIYNPHNKPTEELPFIYGFNNGGREGRYHACLISQDGMGLGSHGCSSENYMLGDLGILEGTRSDRHETFKKHYPDGYRMEFVSYVDVDDHEALQEAFRLNGGRENDRYK